LKKGFTLFESIQYQAKLLQDIELPLCLLYTLTAQCARSK